MRTMRVRDTRARRRDSHRARARGIAVSPFFRVRLDWPRACSAQVEETPVRAHTFSFVWDLGPMDVRGRGARVLVSRGEEAHRQRLLHRRRRHRGARRLRIPRIRLTTRGLYSDGLVAKVHQQSHRRRTRTMHGSRIFGALIFASVAVVAAPAAAVRDASSVTADD